MFDLSHLSIFKRSKKDNKQLIDAIDSTLLELENPFLSDDTEAESKQTREAMLEEASGRKLLKEFDFDNDETTLGDLVYWRGTHSELATTVVNAYIGLQINSKIGATVLGGAEYSARLDDVKTALRRLDEYTVEQLAKAQREGGYK